MVGPNRSATFQTNCECENANCKLDPADEMLGRPVSQCAALCHCVAKGYEAYMRQIDNGSAPSLAL
jgi:hypothetical protein